ncbi:MAG: hypothetical protein B6I22_11260 [Desulfobacteraceae bacterium 4572_123]|nr:MAG: hypothetical protein B6I22_11260 [Desulfobacteraceae bacterium 4572_123]
MVCGGLETENLEPRPEAETKETVVIWIVIHYKKPLSSKNNTTHLKIKFIKLYTGEPLHHEKH